MTETQQEYETNPLKSQNEIIKNKVTELSVDSIHPAPIGPGQMALEAIKSGAGKEVLEHLEKAWEMQKEFDRDTARKAYYEAMSDFAANPPDIDKDQLVEYGTGTNKTSYKHASLGNVTKKIQTALSFFGLHASWQVDQADKTITVTCEISHKRGHSESTKLTAAADNSGAKNAIQSIGSTLTYLERYTILALTGLATHDQDDDGARDAPVEPINKKQYSNLIDMLAEIGKTEAGFCNFMIVDSLDKLPATRYDEAVKQLEKKK